MKISFNKFSESVQESPMNQLKDNTQVIDSLYSKLLRNPTNRITLTKFYFALDCGGKITKGPGTIEQLFVSRNPMHKVNCTWRVHAPENHHVYVKQLRITRTTLQNAEAGKFDDAPFVQVFDGKDMTEENRLFR